MRGNACHPVCNPASLPCCPHEPCYSLSRKAHGTSFFYLLFLLSPLFLDLKKNHFDAKVMHIVRSEALPVVTPFLGISLSLRGLLHHDLMLLLEPGPVPPSWFSWALPPAYRRGGTCARSCAIGGGLH